MAADTTNKSGHNSPPDVTLELTHEQASFLFRACNSSMVTGLSFLQTVEDKNTALALVGTIEEFKGIRELLMKAGVIDPDTPK